jgi:hypothetical protein
MGYAFIRNMTKLANSLYLTNKLLKFKGNVKPVREGWYLCHYEQGRFEGFYRFFDGEWWHNCSIESGVVTLIPIGDPNCWFGIDKS